MAGRNRRGRRAHLVRRAVAAEGLESRLFLTAIAEASPRNGAANVSTSATITATFDVAMDPATVNGSTFHLRDPAGNAVSAAVTYNATTHVATLDPVAPLAVTANYYAAEVRGGASGVKDSAGAALPADVTWSFTTGAAPVFRDTIAVRGLTEPTVVRFARDGRVFVAEKRGVIKVFDNLSDTTPTVFADLRTQVHNVLDRGLLGMALHPNFPATPYVYVLYTCDADVGGTPPKYGQPGVDSDPAPDATGQGALVSGRLSRLTAAGDVMSGAEQVLVHDWAQQFPSHSIGSLQFGPDGALYASAGDGASYNYVDYGQAGNPFGDPVNEGGALRAQDVRSAGDPTSLDGSIIRIDPITGLALPDNPLYPSGDANARRIVAHGLRNPFRFTVRPGTGELWIGDVGWNTSEEIDRLRVPADMAADNFGWPAYEGNARQGAYDATNLPLLESLYAAGSGAVVAPHYAYNHGATVAPGDNTGGSAVAGLAFYTGGAYPDAFDGALFFCDYSRDRIYVMYRGTGPGADPDATNRALLLPSAANPVHLEIGPAGDLFYVDLGGNVHRITYVAPPFDPVKVNFQPAASAVPPGYLADSGEIFGARNGQTYGWNAANSTARDRDSVRSPDQRYDTLVHMQKPGNPRATWELAVPNGTYAVKVVVGDPIHADSRYRIRAEGVLAVWGTPTSRTRWFEGNVTVAVTDGRLTLSSAPGATNNKLCFVEVTQVTAAAAVASAPPRPTGRVADSPVPPAPAPQATVKRRSIADELLGEP